VKILVRESCVDVVKIEFLMQKVEISVRESLPAAGKKEEQEEGKEKKYDNKKR
jgi:hypothetical protein